MKEVILLAGGLGTRLQGVNPHLPKSLAPVAGKAFLSIVIDALFEHNIDRIILSLSYKAQDIIHFIADHYPGDSRIQCVVEPKALGTGGAIKFASQFLSADRFFALNSDTFFDIDLEGMKSFAVSRNADLVLAAKRMLKPHRYGTIDIGDNDQIQKFNEKKELDYGWINGGVYWMKKSVLNDFVIGDVFSFEKEILEKKGGNTGLYAYKSDEAFIDIGIPEDYFRAQNWFSSERLQQLRNQKSNRVLFLDRDGVINVLLPGDYVKNWDEFVFKKDVFEGLRSVNDFFGKMIIITNQQGIAKGKYTHGDLEQIHLQMKNELSRQGIEIDGVYFCPHLESENCNCRKPKPGMFFYAKQDFPNIDLEQSFFVGDQATDVLAAKAAGIQSIALLDRAPTDEMKLAMPGATIFSLLELKYLILEKG